jgi:uncharacterized membrane protein YqgA involved in biofilm formation
MNVYLMIAGLLFGCLCVINYNLARIANALERKNKQAERYAGDEGEESQ